MDGYGVNQYGVFPRHSHFSYPIPQPPAVGASTVPTQGNFGGESWQDGITRRLHHGCNEDELAEARYHDRMREAAWRSQQQTSSYESTYASEPLPACAPPAPRPKGPTAQEKLQTEVRESIRQAAQNLSSSAAPDEGFADDFNRKMEEQIRLMRECADAANTGGQSNADGSRVDFFDIPKYQECVSSGGMPMVRLNVPEGQNLRYDVREKNVVVDRNACLRERAVEALSYSAAAGAGAFLFAKDHCPKGTFYPHCVVGVTLGAGAMNGYRGWRDAGTSPACQPAPANDQWGNC